MTEDKKGELLALADRCQDAALGSRDLDRAIATVIGCDQYYSAGSHRWKLTSSIDAAMTLVPANCAPSLMRLHDGSAKADAHISGCGDMVYADGSTPALALCAAALRARAATPPVESRP